MVGQHTTDDDHERIEALSSRLAEQEAAIRELQRQADGTGDRGATTEAQVAYNGRRISRLEERVEVDEALIAELRAEGLVTKEHAANLEEALTSSRRIGAAIGIVMVRTGATEAEAFALLRKASQDTNRKVRMLADDVVLSGDVDMLRTRSSR